MYNADCSVIAYIVRLHSVVFYVCANTTRYSVSTFRLHLTMVTWLLTNFIATALSMGLECWTQPVRNIKMNSSDRKMDSTDAGRGEWGQSVLGRVHFGKWNRPITASWYLGWGGAWYVVGMRSDEVGRVHFEKMDSTDDRELIFGLECWWPRLADQSKARKWTHPTTWHR